jgi:hypothetical protein
MPNAAHASSGSLPRRGLAVLIDGPVQTGPQARYLHARFTGEPAVARCMAAQASSLDELGRESLHSPARRHVIHRDAALGGQLLDVAVGQAIPQVPADRNGDHLPRKPDPANTEEARGEVIASVFRPPRSAIATLPHVRPAAETAGQVRRSSIRAAQCRWRRLAASPGLEFNANEIACSPPSAASRVLERVRTS